MTFQLTSPNEAAGRRELDAYYTPFPLAQHLVDLLPLREGQRVLEPSAGGGSFLRALAHRSERERLWLRLIALDANPAAPALVQDLGIEQDVKRVHADFLTWPGMGADWVVGNPPYVDAELHVRRAIEEVRVGGHVAFLLRLAFLESAERFEFWTAFPPRKVWVLAERPSFTGGGSDNAAYGFFWWTRGWDAPAELEIVSWKGRRP